MPQRTSIFDAFTQAQRRGTLPTALDTAGLRELDAEVRELAFFSARTTNAIYLSKLKEVIEAVASGTMDEPSARLTLLETLRALGYTPEGGFPTDPPGTVPPAVRGSLQDLAAFKRLNLIVRTLVDLVRGKGQQVRGFDRIAQFPAYELVRLVPKTDKRDWYARWLIAKGDPTHISDPKASDVVGAETGMFALKGDPVFGELGSSENFPDALDVDYSPFAFGSGVGLREVPLARARALGIKGPNGESIEEWFNKLDRDRIRVIGGQVPTVLPGAFQPALIAPQADAELLPVVKVSLKGVDPEIAAAAVQATGATIEDNKAVFGTRAERRAARLQQARAEHAAHMAGGAA